MEHLVISNISLVNKWGSFFVKVLDYCDEFNIVFPNGEPDDENPLLNGRSDFWDLDNVKIEKWLGMEEATSLSGNLTETTRELFIKHIGDLEEGDVGLWQFTLLANKKEFLTIEDFTVCIINNIQKHLQYLESQDIKIEDFI